MTKMLQGRAAICAFVMACTALPEAGAQTPLKATQRPTEQQALADLESFFARDARVYWSCGLDMQTRIKEHELSATGVRITSCNGKHVRDLVFADLPFVVPDREGVNKFSVCTANDAATFAKNGYCPEGVAFLNVTINQAQALAERQAFVNAWLALAYPPPKDPAKDEAFLAALKAATNAGDRTEANRRTQVQVEALVGVGKNKEAAGLYRDALKTSADWASGHYNLALIAGDLGDLTEAITEMRRYLYLEPAAADARAAQDQIYKWEALSEGPPQ